METLYGSKIFLSLQAILLQRFIVEMFDFPTNLAILFSVLFRALLPLADALSYNNLDLVSVIINIKEININEFD